MMKKESWIPISWHCPNCGCVVTGYQNKNGVIKVQCKTCHAVSVCTLKRKHQEIIQVFPPENITEEY